MPRRGIRSAAWETAKLRIALAPRQRLRPSVRIRLGALARVDRLVHTTLSSHASAIPAAWLSGFRVRWVPPAEEGQVSRDGGMARRGGGVNSATAQVRRLRHERCRAVARHPRCSVCHSYFVGFAETCDDCRPRPSGASVRMCRGRVAPPPSHPAGAATWLAKGLVEPFVVIATWSTTRWTSPRLPRPDLTPCGNSMETTIHSAG